MATFLHNGKEIYYEEHGAGDPILILNGIFMSCVSWQNFIPAFSKHNRLLLLDLWDQGRSAKMNKEYTQQEQVDLVVAFLKHIGLAKTNLFGISYGGEIALQVAIQHPHAVSKLFLANTCAYTSPWLKDIGKSWEYAYESNDGHQFFKTCIPIVYSPKFYENNYAWVSAREDLFVELFTKDNYDAFGRLTRSSEDYNVKGQLGEITAETMVLSASLDYVTPPHQQKELVDGISGAGHLTIENAGHSAMYEKPAEFASAVLGFFNADTNINIVKQ